MLNRITNTHLNTWKWHILILLTNSIGYENGEKRSSQQIAILSLNLIGNGLSFKKFIKRLNHLFD